MAVSTIKLDKANNVGSGTNISSYTSEQNPFVCPQDGYVVASCAANGNAKAIGRVLGTNSVQFGGWGANTYVSVPVYVNRGSRIIAVTIENGGNLIYYPLTN